VSARTGPTRVVGIYVFDEVEVLDFAGPFEVLSTASRVSRRVKPEAPPPFTVILVADAARAVRARGGLSVNAGASILHETRLDVLIVPGGEVTQELAKPAVLSWMAHTARATEIAASVCTGAFLLAKAGLLEGRHVTTHWEDLDDLERDFPSIHVERQIGPNFSSSPIGCRRILTRLVC
jgi:transcriptional regulator GlxA family with amidase domain